MNLAVIPARGGSKRIPRKNIRLFCGKPIIAYSIEAAIDSGLFDEIIVSTDDEKIAEIAMEYGAKVPFFRPIKLADDYAGTIPVVQHAILQAEDYFKVTFPFVCCIYATAPLLQITSLEKAYVKLQDNVNVDFTFAATEFSYPIFRSFKLSDQGSCQMFWPEKFACRSQDLPKAYHDAGQFYWGRRGAFLRKPSFFGERSVPIILPKHLVQDIDTMEDWIKAEQLFKLMAQDL